MAQFGTHVVHVLPVPPESTPILVYFARLPFGLKIQHLLRLKHSIYMSIGLAYVFKTWKSTGSNEEVKISILSQKKSNLYSNTITFRLKSFQLVGLVLVSIK